MPIITRNEDAFSRITQLVDARSAQKPAMRIAISAHMSADGDAIGSNLALGEALALRYPQADIQCLLADKDAEVPRTYRFLPGADRMLPVNCYEGLPDVLFVVDLSSLSRLGYAKQLCEQTDLVIVLDHHPSEEHFWQAGLINTNAAACAVIIRAFIAHMGISLTPTMAQNLMCGLMTDTGCFQYQNVNSEAFYVASDLVDVGASPSDIALHVYQSDRLSYVHLCAIVMQRICTFAEGKVAYSYTTLADLTTVDVPLSECDGLIDMVRRVEGAEIALFLKEVPGGIVRGNLRAKNNTDISDVARIFGGGGHKAASGFSVVGTIDEVFSQILPLLVDVACTGSVTSQHRDAVSIKAPDSKKDSDSNAEQPAQRPANTCSAQLQDSQVQDPQGQDPQHLKTQDSQGDFS